MEVMIIKCCPLCNHATSYHMRIVVPLTEGAPCRFWWHSKLTGHRRCSCVYYSDCISEEK